MIGCGLPESPPHTRRLEAMGSFSDRIGNSPPPGLAVRTFSCQPSAFADEPAQTIATPIASPAIPKFEGRCVLSSKEPSVHCGTECVPYDLGLAAWVRISTAPSQAGLLFWRRTVWKLIIASADEVSDDPDLRAGLLKSFFVETDERNSYSQSSWKRHLRRFVASIDRREPACSGQ